MIKPRSALALIFLLSFSLAACSGDDTTAPPPPPPHDPGLDLIHPGVTLLQRPAECLDGDDCLGFVQVLWSGEIRVNPLGDPLVITSIDTLSAIQLDQVRSLALDTPMVEIFKQGDAGCGGTQNPIEELRLFENDDLFSVKITGCTTGPAADLRDLLLSLGGD